MLLGRLSLGLCALWMAFGQFSSRAQLFLVAQQSGTNPPAPGQVALGWNASPDTRGTGYFLGWRLDSSDCTNFLDVGNVTNATVAGLASNVGYYFTIVTYDAAGDQSPPSNQITVTLTPANPVVTTWPTASTITYGQTLAVSTLSGGAATPAGTFACTTPSTAPNAGTALQSVTYAPTDTTSYNSSSSTVSVPVNPKALTVTGITANDKVYDGNSTATLNTTGAILVGMMPGDAVALNTAGATGAFTDPDVGTAKTVLVSGSTLSGMDAGNYTLIQPTTTANITQASSATALVSSANPSLQGFSVTFTATATPVEPASTPPPGNVQFYTNGVALGSPVALTDGVGSLSAADLPAGTNTVLAAYLGGSNFLGSSNSVAQLVVVVAGRPSTPSTIGIQNNADGTVTVTFAGTPDAQLVVQASDNLAPGAWENVSTNTAGTDGQWTFTVSTEHYPGRFYRSAIP
jgi:hypothetical protein